jgi:hypothetical protein
LRAVNLAPDTINNIPISRIEIVFATCFRADSCLEGSLTSSIPGAVSVSTSGVLALDRSDDKSEDNDDSSLPPYVIASDVFSRGELSEDDSVAAGWELKAILK